jgi:hypothetical protein
MVVGNPTPFDSSSPKSAVVVCPPGKRVLSVGTGSTSSLGERPVVIGLTGLASASGVVTMAKTDGMNFSFSAAAMCASLAP